MPKGFSLSFLTRNADVALALGVIGILIVMLVPMPTAVMDFLLAVNVALALLVLLVSMYITNPLQFSVFPGMLLIITLFRLSLNVATTRLILGDAYAGKMISAFGNFVVKGNYVVGFIIFLILVIINFIVITKGAGRVAEVGARFTLDSMPGKQMSIDADLNAGVIDEVEARQRRDQISQEADFYGAMDGASKFVRGDAIAGLIITMLNIVGGFIVGVAQMHMGLNQALTTYTRLTIGDGLVSQIPALIISTSAGIIVTRAASNSNLGQDLVKQLFFNSRVAYIVASVLALLAISPGLPFVPFVVLATGMGAVGYVIKEQPAEADEIEDEIGEEPEREDDIQSYLRVEPLELEIGYNLIPLVDIEQQGDLLSRINQIRKQCAMDLGVIIPPIRIRDDMRLQPNEYIMLIKGNEVARNSLMLGHYLALNPGIEKEELQGMKVKEPAFGLPAVWVKGDEKEKAELMGYTLVAPAAVLATHLSELLRIHAAQIITRQDVHDLLENLKKDQAALVGELIPDVLSTGSVEKVLKNLLSERVSIRDLGTIMETLAEHIHESKDLDLLTEHVRQALSQSIIMQYQDREGRVNALTLDPDLEQMLNNALAEAKKSGIAGTQALGFYLSTDVLQKLLSALSDVINQMEAEGRQPLIITSPSLRPYLRKLVEPIFKTLSILSYAEIPAHIEIQTTGIVRLDNEG
ncbi:MAG: flagellar biosynthesis protein FlhA [Calditrichaeota bacterium]|nr:flagellar biosynthesis protein FlhA [Calditrichota bacterium]